jgi:hypothetical protein
VTRDEPHLPLLSQGGDEQQALRPRKLFTNAASRTASKGEICERRSFSLWLKCPTLGIMRENGLRPRQKRRFPFHVFARQEASKVFRISEREDQLIMASMTGQKGKLGRVAVVRKVHGSIDAVASLLGDFEKVPSWHPILHALTRGKNQGRGVGSTLEFKAKVQGSRDVRDL